MGNQIILTSNRFQYTLLRALIVIGFVLQGLPAATQGLSVKAEILLVQPTADGALRISYRFTNSLDFDLCIKKSILQDSYSPTDSIISIRSTTRGELPEGNLGFQWQGGDVNIVNIPVESELNSSVLLGETWAHDEIITTSGDVYSFRLSIKAWPCEVAGFTLEDVTDYDLFIQFIRLVQSNGNEVYISSTWSNPTHIEPFSYFPLDR